MLQMLFEKDHGQDLVEYSLLLAFVCLVGAAMFIGMGQNVTGIWSVTNHRLTCADQSTSHVGCP